MMQSFLRTDLHINICIYLKIHGIWREQEEVVLSAGFCQSCWLSAVQPGTFQTPMERGWTPWAGLISRWEKREAWSRQMLEINSRLLFFFPLCSLLLLKFQLFGHIHEETEIGWNHTGNKHRTQGQGHVCKSKEIKCPQAQVPINRFRLSLIQK